MREVPKELSQFGKDGGEVPLFLFAVSTIKLSILLLINILILIIYYILRNIGFNSKWKNKRLKE